MESYSFDITKTDYWSKEINQFLKGEFGDLLSQFEPHEDGILEAANNRQFSKNSRTLLVEALRQKYEQIGIKPRGDLDQNLTSLLQSNTFTITTGQQLHIGLGPLYVFHKIISVIITAKRLNANSEKRFVPVFWLASEDHDVEEIDHVYVNGTLHRWNQKLSGPVGHLDTTGLDKLLVNVIEEAINAGIDPSIWQQFKDIYAKYDSFGAATFYAVHTIFEAYGLVIIDADDPLLKQHLTPILTLDANGAVESLLKDQTKKLKTKGIKAQIGAQRFNHFYLSAKKGYRSKISLVQDQFETEDRAYSWTIDELLEEANHHPQNFSPNVSLRPIYQEMCLPNVAYLGGPGEMKYWWQLKPLFQLFDLQMPSIPPRIAAVAIPKKYKSLFLKSAIQKGHLSTSFDIKKTLLLDGESANIVNNIVGGIKQLNLVQEALPDKNQHFHDKSVKQIDRALEKLFRSEKYIIEELFQNRYDSNSSIKMLITKYLDFSSPMERTSYFPNITLGADSIASVVESIFEVKTNNINVLTIYFH